VEPEYFYQPPPSSIQLYTTAELQLPAAAAPKVVKKVASRKFLRDEFLKSAAITGVADRASIRLLVAKQASRDAMIRKTQMKLEVLKVQKEELTDILPHLNRQLHIMDILQMADLDTPVKTKKKKGIIKELHPFE
jgi:hypothetical protein